MDEPKVRCFQSEDKGVGRGLRQWGKASLRQGWKTKAKCLMSKIGIRKGAGREKT